MGKAYGDDKIGEFLGKVRGFGKKSNQMKINDYLLGKI